MASRYNKTKPFRLLDLPLVPMRTVLQDMDVIQLAICSKKSRKVIKKMRFKVDNFIVGSSGFQLTILPNTLVTWSFSDIYDHRSDSLNFSTKYRIGGADFPTEVTSWRPNEINNVSLYDSKKVRAQPLQEVFQLANTRSKGKCYFTRLFVPAPLKISGYRLPRSWSHDVCKDPKIACNILVEFIKDLFQTNATGYDISLGSVRDFEAFFVENVVHGGLKTFEVNGLGKEARNPSINSETFLWILQFLPLKTKLIVGYGWGFDRSFQLERPLLHEAIEFKGDLPWFNRHHLLTSKCKQLEIHWPKHQLTAADIAQFIQNWMDGTDTEFQYLDVSLSHNIYLQNIIFGGFQVKPYDRNRWIRSFEATPLHKLVNKLREVDYLTMKDIQRKDGLMATIRVIEELNFTNISDRIIFNVWHLKQKKKTEPIMF